jgi:hypothetical protein
VLHQPSTPEQATLVRLDFAERFAELKGGASPVTHVHEQVENPEELLAERGRHWDLTIDQVLD